MSILTAEQEAAFEEISSSRLIDRHAVAHDASHYLLVPNRTATARDARDVAAAFAAARVSGAPLTLRSGGTSLSGQASGAGIVLDVRSRFRGIDVLDDGARVRVQPGATVRQVNARLARHGRKLGPDPASEIACTIGGVIANNSGGMACGTAHNTYRTLESATLVLPSGTIIDTADPDADADLHHSEPDLAAGLLRLRDRVRADAASVATIGRLFAMKNTMGYGLNALLDYDRAVDLLLHLVIGSEGTLAFVADAVFRTVALHPRVATGLLVFDDVDRAMSALPELTQSDAAAIELMDPRSLRLAQQGGAPDAISRLDVRGHAALLVEYAAETQDELEAREATGARLIRTLALAAPASFTHDAAERAALWHVRKGLYATVAGARATGTTALLEDVVVPVPALGAACRDLTSLFDRFGYHDSVIFGHARDGNVHFMLTDDFSSAERLDAFAGFTEEMVDVILGLGGSLKAEHGTGRAMAPFVRRQYGDELYAVMVDLKGLFDPHGFMNPGVILNDDPLAHLRDLKPAVTIEPEADRCVECGYCEPACPSRDLTLTPRQRIAVRRAMVTAEEAGDDDTVAALRADYDYSAVQTCAVDGMCQTACPVTINTGDLMKRFRTQDQDALTAGAWTLAARTWSGTTRAASAVLTAAAVAPPALVRGANRAARAVLGDDRIPLWSEELPRGGHSRTRPAPRRPVDAVYLPACVNTMFGPADGSPGVQRSFEELCASAGIELLVPEGIDALCCGTPWSSKGIPAGAAVMRGRVRKAIELASRDGELPVVCDASSCTEGFRSALAAAGIADRIRMVDAVTFVAEVVLPRLGPHDRLESITVHPTCSSARMGTTADLVAVASAVADQVMIPDSWGCCGFAGDRGMLHPELTASATAAQAEEVRAFGAQAHVSCNRTCELGMTRATGTPYRHVLEVLADQVRGSDA